MITDYWLLELILDACNESRVVFLDGWTRSDVFVVVPEFDLDAEVLNDRGCDSHIKMVQGIFKIGRFPECGKVLGQGSIFR